MRVGPLLGTKAMSSLSLPGKERRMEKLLRLKRRPKNPRLSTTETWGEAGRAIVAEKSYRPVSERSCPPGEKKGRSAEICGTWAQNQ
jgi:hypothetical protein